MRGVDAWGWTGLCVEPVLPQGACQEDQSRGLGAEITCRELGGDRQ